MSKRDYKAAYGWLALGGVLVIALGAALFYHHSANQSERTPAQEAGEALKDAEKGDMGVVCNDDLWREEELADGFEETVAFLNQMLHTGVTITVSGATGRVRFFKSLKVSAPTIHTYKVGRLVLLNICVTVSKE